MVFIAQCEILGLLTVNFIIAINIDSLTMRGNSFVLRTKVENSQE